jgi:hypothetical protein
MVSEPAVESVGDAFGLRHPADAGCLIHHPLALSDCELTEQKKAFARGSGDPIWIAAAGIEKDGLRGLCALLCPIDEFVLDLERAECFEFA